MFKKTSEGLPISNNKVRIEKRKKSQKRERFKNNMSN